MTIPTISATADPALDLLCDAFNATVSIIESVSTEELTMATPCPGWDVKTIIDHIAGALEMFGGALGLDLPDTASLDPASAVRIIMDAVAAGWSAPDRLASTTPLAFGTFPAPLALRINVLETFVHGLDIAVAVGRADLVDEALCRDIQTMAEAAGFDAFRQPGMFGPAVTPRDAAPSSALMAYVGRTI